MNKAERAILDLAAGQHWAFSRQQAREAGMSVRAIDYRLKQKDWALGTPGTYVLAASERTWEQEAMAGCLAAGPGAVASHRTAAVLLGFPGVVRRIEVTVPRPKLVRIKGVVGHQARSAIPEGDRAVAHGIPVTSGVRTLVDLTAIFDAGKLGPLLDHAITQRMINRDELESRARELLKSRPRLLRTLAVLLDERPATPRPMGSDFEAKLFQGLRAAGLPIPVPQYRVLMEDGSDIFLDFAYPEAKLAIEADSFLWHSSLRAWQRDRARNNELVAMGWSILPITYDLVMYRPAEVARQVGLALQARRAG